MGAKLKHEIKIIGEEGIEKWTRECFIRTLTEDVEDEEIEKLGEMTLTEIVRRYADRWADFCVIEGVEWKMIEVFRG